MVQVRLPAIGRIETWGTCSLTGNLLLRSYHHGPFRLQLGDANLIEGLQELEEHSADLQDTCSTHDYRKPSFPKFLYIPPYTEIQKVQGSYGQTCFCPWR